MGINKNIFSKFIMIIFKIYKFMNAHSLSHCAARIFAGYYFPRISRSFNTHSECGELWSLQAFPTRDCVRVRLIACVWVSCSRCCPSRFWTFFYVPRKPSLLPSPLPVAAVVHAADLSIVTATRGCGSATHSRPRVLFAHNGKSSGLGGFSSFSSFPCFPTFPATQGKA